jgi:outer membrane cobalamin receptor
MVPNLVRSWPIAVAFAVFFALRATRRRRRRRPLVQPLDIHVVVVGTTPLPGVEQPVDRVPAPVQTATAADLEKSGALDLSDFANRRLQGVHVNEMQGNPFQPDVNYRGYTASPLLGTPQGLSVYMDGVRLNQPFGDVVSWDLIPRMAIASAALMPGSNPMFGLNTLGGALAVTTKSGISSPGTTIQGSYGSDVRRAIDFEHGGSKNARFNWYLAATLFAEDGWRDDSPRTCGRSSASSDGSARAARRR